MAVSRIGRLLLGLGVLVGAVACVGLLIGFEPARLPPALLTIAVYKLLFMSALAILAAGAVVLRYALGAEGRARGARAPDGDPVVRGGAARDAALPPADRTVRAARRDPHARPDRR